MKYNSKIYTFTCKVSTYNDRFYDKKHSLNHYYTYLPHKHMLAVLVPIQNFHAQRPVNITIAHQR